jgi:tetratricopeptide (TPR) repeat protein
VIVSLLLLGAWGCAKRADTDYQNTLNEATLAMRRGELDAARTIADQGVARTGAQPSSEWAWRFTLLLSEVLLRKHELPEAQRLMNAEVPEGAAFDLLRARRQFLIAYEQVIEGNRQQAAETVELARGLTPATPAADDLRFDIDMLDGVIALQLGRREQGESRLNQVLAAATAKGDRYHQAVALNNLGMGQFVQKRYDAALARFERVLALTDLKGLTIYADALNNAGMCYSRLGQFDRAVAAQRQAVERHNRGARREYEQALGQLGTTYLDAGNDREGLLHLRQALGVASEAGLAADAAVWAGNLAAAHVKLGELEDAERFNDEAKRFKTAAGSGGAVYNTLRAADIATKRGQLAEASRLFGEALAASPGDPSVLWSAHEGLAQVAVAGKHAPDAMRHFEAALATIEKTRSDLIRTDYKLSYLTRLIAFYRAYVDALVDQGQIERALEVADSSRGRVLAERQGVASPKTLRAASFRERAARSGTVFLSYWLGPERSYLWIITPARVQIVTLPPAPEIGSLVRQHQAAIDNVMADPLKAVGGAGDRLFQVLVQPALSSIPRGGSVLIVPDAALYALNFETLPVAQPRADCGPPTADGRLPTADCRLLGRHYWIEDAEIAIAPSLAMLNSPPPARGPANSLLLIGNPTPRDPEYPALKYAGAEMTGVARHFPAGRVTTFQGGQALPASYRAAKPDQFSHVHFTAHATANLDSPLDSAVILSGPDAAFKLYARDVAAQPLQAELVTVSACRSAGERTYSGEGLVGFAWAFLRGGARRVVAGLWDVDDKSTAELMDLLYAGLAAGDPAGKALRAAKLTLLRRGGATAQPYYWAPFELFTLSP